MSVVNLRRFRKAKARDEAAKDADANRAKFGRAKSEKEKQALEEKTAAKLLDHSKLDTKGER